MQLVHIIVGTKAIAGLWCLLLALYYQNFSPAAAVQTAIRSAYGLAWIVQHHCYPTQTWDYVPDASVAIAVFVWLQILVPTIDLLCIQNTAQQTQTNDARQEFLILSLCVFLFSTGLLFMMVTDSTTRVQLKFRKGLITTGLNALMRHPNYFGETLIYTSFCLNARSLYAWGIMLIGWTVFVIPSMLKKEQRLSRHAEWEQYCQNCGLLWPKLGGASSPGSSGVEVSKIE